jgi:hypothetical protein
MSAAASPAALAARTLAALRHGDASALEDLRPVAAGVAPDAAMELLDAAAFADDAAAVDTLYGLFHTFEMPSVPLAHALAHSCAQAANALLDHGATLSAPFLPASLAGDTNAWRARRWTHYLDRMLPRDFRSIPGRAASTLGTGRAEPGLVFRIAVAKNNHALLTDLVSGGRLPQQDADILLFAALLDGYLDLARTLAAAGANPRASVRFRLRYGPGWGMTCVRALPDVFFETASIDLARTLVDLAPETAGLIWSDALPEKNPGVARLLVPFLEPAAVADPAALARSLARDGHARELALVLAWPLEDPAAVVSSALDAATEARMTEAQLVCLNVLRELDPAPQDDLEL